MKEFKQVKKLVVVDIETGAKSVDAHIYSIGAAIVCLETKAIEDIFYTRVGEQAGRVTDAETLAWWLRQANDSPEAFREIFMQQDPAPSLKVCLINFSSWLLTHFKTEKDVQMVGNGPEFDNAILLNAYAQLGLKEPWPYWNNQSMRTFKLIHRINGFEPVENMAFEGTKHHAGDDAYYEACQLISILKEKPIQGCNHADFIFPVGAVVGASKV